MIAQLLTLHFLQSILDVAKGIVSESNFCIVCEVLCAMQRRVLIMLKVNIRFPPFLMNGSNHFSFSSPLFILSNLMSVRQYQHHQCLAQSQLCFP